MASKSYMIATFEGGGTYLIRDRTITGTDDTKFKVIETDNHITIQVKGGLYVNGGVSFNFGRIFQGVSIVGQCISVSGNRNSVIVNGLRYVPHTKAEEGDDSVWVTEHTCKSDITSVNVRGCAKVSLATPYKIGTMIITGNGEINVATVDVEMKGICAEVTGNGSLDFGRNVYTKGQFEVTGNGTISAITISSFAKAEVTGNGDIRMHKSEKAKVIKDVTGNGSIKVSRE